MSTVAASGDELALRLCDLVGADPTQTTRIILEAEAGKRAVIRWDCIARVPLEDVAAAISGADLEHEGVRGRVVLGVVADDDGDDAGPAGP